MDKLTQQWLSLWPADEATAFAVLWTGRHSWDESQAARSVMCFLSPSSGWSSGQERQSELIFSSFMCEAANCFPSALVLRVNAYYGWLKIDDYRWWSFKNNTHWFCGKWCPETHLRSRLIGIGATKKNKTGIFDIQTLNSQWSRQTVSSFLQWVCFIYRRKMSCGDRTRKPVGSVDVVLSRSTSCMSADPPLLFHRNC